MNTSLVRDRPGRGLAALRDALFGASAGALPPGRAWLLAIWFGMLMGLVDAVHALVMHGLRLKPVWGYTSAVVWMAPAASILIFGVLGGFAYALLRTRPTALRLQTAAAGFSFIVWYGLLRTSLAPVHPAAAAVLAVGLAVRTGRLILDRWDRFWPFCRRSLVVSTGVVVLAAAVLHGSARVSGSRYARTRPVAAVGMPNVLLLILDTVRGQSLSLYGYERPTTPGIDRFAATGVVFEHAIAAAPWTLPSHASMFTGRHAGELAADWDAPLSDRDSTLAEVLHTAGYQTAGFVANIVYASEHVGLDRGFSVYRDHPRSVETVILQSWLATRLSGPVKRLLGDRDLLARKSAGEVNDEFLAWLDRKDGGPFFAFLNYYDAHGPYLPPPPFDDHFGTGDPLPELDVHERTHGPDDLRRLKDGYDNALAFLDTRIERLLDTLAARGILDSTIVILTSDHGEELGEHGLLDHGNSLYLPSLRVPLILSSPGRVPSGVLIPEPVGLRDLAATILDLAGLDPDRLPGTSLARYWEGDPPDSGHPFDGAVLSEVSRKPWEIPDWFPIARGDMQSLVAANYHYIRNGDGSEELYDLTIDPWEADDLAGTAIGLGLLPAFRERLPSRVSVSERAGTR